MVSKKQLSVLQSSGSTILENVLLKQYTSLGIGGPAAVFSIAKNVLEAQRLISAAKEAGVKIFVLGGGTNILFSDDGFDGLVIKTAFDGLEFNENSVVVGSGINVSNLVEKLIKKGFSGLEFAAGLPGTIGGAVAGNAGCFGSSMCDILICAKVLRQDGTTAIINYNDFGFDYRYSSIRDSGVIIFEVELKICPGNKEELQKIANEHVELRKKKHPGKHLKTAGSWFKNLPPEKEGQWRRSAGLLLDAVGAKNIKENDAAVFDKHANILVNLGNATAVDMLALQQRLQNLVYEQFEVILEPEVRRVGFFSE